MDVHTKKYIYRILTHLVCNIFKNGYLRKVFPRKTDNHKETSTPTFFDRNKKYDILVLKKKNPVKKEDSRQFSPFPQKHTISLEFLK